MIPESIKKLAQKVRTEIYGRDVRESIAQSMEVSGETSNEANERSKDTATRQTDVENRFDDQIAGNTDIDEVIDARRPEGGKSYPTLRKRLDDEHKEVTTQLAQNTEYTTTNFNYLNDSKKERKVIVSFIVDDAPKRDLTTVVPIMIEKKIPMGFGVITDRVGKIVPNDAGTINHEYMTWEDIRYVQSLGGEIMAHTHKHRNSTQLSEDVLYEDIATNKRILSEQGFIADGFIYPYNAFNNMTKNVVNDFFKYSFARNTSNTPKIDNNSINRYSLGAYYDVPSLSPKGYNTSSLEYYKERVDIAIERDEWLVFVIHTHEGVFDETQQQHLRDVIDYIRSLGVEIVSPREGFNRYGNIIQVGSARLDAVGHGNLRPVIVTDVDETTADMPISNFEKNAITITPTTYTTAVALGLSHYPVMAAGVMTTYNLANNTMPLIYRTYESTVLYNGQTTVNETHIQNWENNKWQPWRLLASTEPSRVFKSRKNITANTIIDVSDRENYVGINAPHPTGGAIEQITGGVEGTEVIIFNALQTDIIIKHHDNYGNNRIMLNGRADLTLGSKQALRLLKVGNWWIQV